MKLLGASDNKLDSFLRDESKLTPMMKQFRGVKVDYPDMIAFFRMGDFYEMFGSDAEAATKVLGITLTSRDKKKDDGVPMCGIPHHSYESYLIKLVKAGLSVAICEQLEDPRFVKGLVKRGVTRVVTPGTLIEDAALNALDNNFLASVYKDNETFYVVYTDISTGEVILEKNNSKSLKDSFCRFKPSEYIVNELTENYEYMQVTGYRYGAETAENKVLEHFKAGSAKTIDVHEKGFIFALYQTITYFERIMLDIVLKKPKILIPEDYLFLDSVAASTLELTAGNDGTEKNSLFSVLNRCRTAMGSRQIKSWLKAPLRNKDKIVERHEIVEHLINNSSERGAIADSLSKVYDLERIVTRLLAARCNARDLVWLKTSISEFPKLKKILAESTSPVLSSIGENFDDLIDVFTMIDNAIEEEPPATIKDGGIIKLGYNDEVDDLKGISVNSKKLLAAIETKEKGNTGISTLKVKYNKVFGYYIEISKSHISKVPDYYERKQTLVNAERYIIPELKVLEEKILNADEKLVELEYDLFSAVRDKVAENSDRIRDAAVIVKDIDCLLSFAEVSEDLNYVRPNMRTDGVFDIKNGRHPVVERNLSGGFVPNDIYIDKEKNRLKIITGPNMAGKSTYLRMTAVIAVMAHCGCFVPAESADISILDRIFTRVGASDNLAGGESTFMVEMVEAANILNNATDDSLIILDELGRGTSTYDGVSIAWSVAEYIVNTVKAKTLFATHYHELTDIAVNHDGVVNMTTDVQEWNDELIFMRRVIPGSADRSYGIHVAKLAGLPDEVIKRGYEILNTLEKDEYAKEGLANIVKLEPKKEEKIVQRLLFFEDHPVVDELRTMDLNSVTPIDALNKLYELKKKAEDEQY